MTDRWDRFLAKLSAAMRAQLVAWYNGRPPAIQALIRAVPPNTAILVGGRKAWIVSYQEISDGPPGAMFSFTNPSVDYDRASASRFYVCADHFGPLDLKDTSP